MDCKTTQKMVGSYIKKQLSSKGMEAFLDHMKDCKECREELEIYLTIHLALQKLDEEKDVSYNIQKLLKDNLASATRRVHRFKVMRICNITLILLAEAVLTIVLLTQLQAWNIGGYRSTYMFRTVNETETEMVKETQIESESQIEIGKRAEKSNE